MNHNLPLKKERRAFPRFEASCRCWVEHDSLTLFGTVTNLSSAGFFLRTLPVMDAGAVIDIRLNKEAGDVLARGEICWTNIEYLGPRDSFSATPLGLGVRFLEITDGAALMQNFFARNSIVPIPEPPSRD